MKKKLLKLYLSKCSDSHLSYIREPIHYSFKQVEKFLERASTKLERTVAWNYNKKKLNDFLNLCLKYTELNKNLKPSQLCPSLLLGSDYNDKKACWLSIVNQAYTICLLVNNHFTNKKLNKLLQIMLANKEFCNIIGAIDLKFSKIKNFDATFILEAFPLVERLSLSENFNLVTFQLLPNNMQALTHLFLEENTKLSQVEIRNCHNLLKIYIFCNNLKNIRILGVTSYFKESERKSKKNYIYGLPSLVRLKLSACKLLQQICLKALPKLKYVYINDSKLCDIQLDSLLALNTLDLSNNKLSESGLKCSFTSRIIELNLSKNNFVNYNFINPFPYLEWLNLSHNSLSFIKIPSSIAPISIRLYNNQLVKVELASTCQNLINLSLDNNKLEEIVLSHYQTLSSKGLNLDLSNNAIYVFNYNFRKMLLNIVRMRKYNGDKQELNCYKCKNLISLWRFYLFLFMFDNIKKFINEVYLKSTKNHSTKFKNKNVVNFESQYITSNKCADIRIDFLGIMNLNYINKYKYSSMLSKTYGSSFDKRETIASGDLDNSNQKEVVKCLFKNLNYFVKNYRTMFDEHFEIIMKQKANNIKVELLSLFDNLLLVQKIYPIFANDIIHYIIRGDFYAHLINILKDELLGINTWNSDLFPEDFAKRFQPYFGVFKSNQEENFSYDNLTKNYKEKFNKQYLDFIYEK